jgi:hypothetical protein
MPVNSDGTRVSNESAFAVWLPLARKRLLDAASTYGGWLTYGDLADFVQQGTGTTTTQQLNHWIGDFLEIVSNDANQRAEPRLTSLCVGANQKIGESYPWALEAKDDSERQEIAAQDRLDCYRRFAPDLPLDGGIATVRLEAEKRLATSIRASATAPRHGEHGTHWLVASDVKKFNSDAAFAALERIDWSESKSAGILVGDTVYLYATSPTSAITHECLVVEAGIPFDDVIDDQEFWVDEQAFADRKDRTWMGLQLIRAFSADERRELSLRALLDNGLNAAPQGRMRVRADLLSYVRGVVGSPTESHEGRPSDGPPVQGFWWVNQVNSWHRDKNLTQLWAPLTDDANRPQSHWESLENANVGDLVLHYAGDHVMGASVVAERSQTTVRPAMFATGIRAGDLGRLVVLRDYQLFDIPVHRQDISIDLRRSESESGGPFDSLGRLRRGYFFPLSQASAIAVFAAANLVVTAAEAHGSGSTPDSEQGATERFLDLTSTDGVVVARYRREQGGLRAALFGTRAEARCEICSRQYPVRYLRAAHIKSRSACSFKERTDWRNIVMAACVFGCDAMFEDGLLRIGPEGVISLAPGHDQTRALAAFSGSLVGRKAPAFRPENRKYFEWRYSKSLDEWGG